MGVYNPQSRNKMVYTDFTIVNYGDVYPFTLSKISKKFQTYQADLYYDPLTHTNTNGFRYTYDEFLKNCMFDFVVMEHNTNNVLEIFQDKRFNTEGNFYSFIRNTPKNNGTLYTEELKIRIFNYVDNEIDTTNKIGSYNSFYSALCTTAKMERTYSLGDAINKSHHSSFQYYKEFLVGAYQELFGIDISADYDLNPNDFLKTAYITLDKHKKLYRYRKLYSNISIEDYTSIKNYFFGIIYFRKNDFSVFKYFDNARHSLQTLFEAIQYREQ